MTLCICVPLLKIKSLVRTNGLHTVCYRQDKEADSQTSFWLCPLIGFVIQHYMCKLLVNVYTVNVYTDGRTCNGVFSRCGITPFTWDCEHFYQTIFYLTVIRLSSADQRQLTTK